jgi:lysophospholipase L1-like esterase
VLSCADVPGTQDFVLTPGDIARIETQLAEMQAHARQIALDNGYAFFDLNVLYARRDLKSPFSATTLLASAEPYGPYFSADGVHPSAAGHRVIAREAARVLNVTYHLAIDRGRLAEEALASRAVGGRSR